MKKKMFFSWLVGTVIVFLSAQVMAQGGRIHYGKLKVIPEVEFQYLYDDNIYLGNGSNNTDELKESDWIFHVKPALFLGYSLGERGGLKLGYLGDFAYYTDNNDNDWKTTGGCLNWTMRRPAG